jgi:hypothetical protein
MGTSSGSAWSVTPDQLTLPHLRHTGAAAPLGRPLATTRVTGFAASAPAAVNSAYTMA